MKPQQTIDRINAMNRRYARTYDQNRKVADQMLKKPRSRRLGVASLTIHRAGSMTALQRRALAGWLRKQAKHVERHGVVYATRFTARYR